MTKIWVLLTDKDWKTWVGHFLMGFALTWLWSWEVTFGAFFYREGDNLWEWFRDKRPQGEDYKTNTDVKRPRDGKLMDGLMDFIAAMVGAALAETLKPLLV